MSPIPARSGFKLLEYWPQSTAPRAPIVFDGPAYISPAVPVAVRQ
jgi:hypothetical protein